MKQVFTQSIVFYSCLAVLVQTAACNKNVTAELDSISYENTPLAYPLTTLVSEASGIADSKINTGYLWVQEDSGNPPQLYLLNHAATTVKKIYIKGAVNRDWEDIALASGPDAAKKYLYIAEIGDNDAIHTSSSFYRLEEPAAATDTVRAYDIINFTYADGPRDAEAFLVDDLTKDIYIISKREAQSRVYRISYPYSTTVMNTAVFVQTLPYNAVVSAAAGNDGKSIIIKTYQALYYYSRIAGETMAQTLQKEFKNLGYQLEPQGESVGFALDNSGFYTLSEKGPVSSQSLYFYKKK
ncbi:MAG: hypothetical protein ABIQ88_02840 [Chitinophagaceae bacterium]